MGKGKRVKGWNSTLGRDPEKTKAFRERSTPLRSRTLEERYGDDPFRYGVLFKRVRTWPCMGTTHLRGAHKCGPGYAPPSAHHLGETDVEGMVPVCGRLHDILETVSGTREVDRALREQGKTLAGVGMGYVRTAAQVEQEQGTLPEELEHVLEAA